MRLTINLKDNLYRVAIAQDCSISAAVNRLLEQGLDRSHPKRKITRNDFPLSKGRRHFTSDEVYAMDQA